MRRQFNKTDEATNDRKKESKLRPGRADSEWSITVLLLCFGICYVGVIADIYMSEDKHVRDITTPLTKISSMLNVSTTKAVGAPLGWMPLAKSSMRKGDTLFDLNLSGEWGINYKTATERYSTSKYTSAVLASPLLESTTEEFKRHISVVTEIVIVLSESYSHTELNLNTIALVQQSNSYSLLSYGLDGSEVPMCLNAYSRKKFYSLKATVGFIYLVISEVMNDIKVETVLRAVDIFLSRTLPKKMCSEELQPCLVPGIEYFVPAAGTDATLVSEVINSRLVVRAKHTFPMLSLLSVDPPLDFLSDFDYRGVVPHNTIYVVPIPLKSFINPDDNQLPISQIPPVRIESGWSLLNISDTRPSDVIISDLNEIKKNFLLCSNSSDPTAALNIVMRNLLVKAGADELTSNNPL